MLIAWDDVISSSHEIDDAYRSWFDIFKQIIDVCTPNKEITVRPNDKPWMNGLVQLKSGGVLPSLCFGINFVPPYQI